MAPLRVKTTSSRPESEYRRFARMGMELAELVEDFVELTVDYRTLFIHDLECSLREATQGKARRISSLRELA